MGGAAYLHFLTNNLWPATALGSSPSIMLPDISCLEDTHTLKVNMLNVHTIIIMNECQAQDAGIEKSNKVRCTRNLTINPEIKVIYQPQCPVICPQNIQQYSSCQHTQLMRVEMFPLFSSISNFLKFLIVGLRREPLIRTLPPSCSSSSLLFCVTKIKK